MVSAKETKIAGIIGSIQGYCDSIIEQSKEAGAVACASKILDLSIRLRALVLTTADGEAK
jgi:hypothetical protein